MLVDLERVPPEGQAIDRSIDPSVFAPAGPGGNAGPGENAACAAFDESEFRLSKAVCLTALLTKANEASYRLQGELVSAVELSCVRCLEPFESDVREKLNLIYRPQSENVASAEEDGLSLGDDELAVSFYSDDELDLAHMIWEQITLAMPMKPICKPACQGLCPSCGVNRNETTCACVHDNTDPRWQSLKSLLEP